MSALMPVYSLPVFRNAPAVTYGLSETNITMVMQHSPCIITGAVGRRIPVRILTEEVTTTSPRLPLLLQTMPGQWVIAYLRTKSARSSTGTGLRGVQHHLLCPSV